MATDLTKADELDWGHTFVEPREMLRAWFVVMGLENVEAMVAEEAATFRLARDGKPAEPAGEEDAA